MADTEVNHTLNVVDSKSCVNHLETTNKDLSSFKSSISNRLQNIIQNSTTEEEAMQYSHFSVQDSKIPSTIVDSASNVLNAVNSTNTDEIAAMKDLQEVQANEKEEVDVIDDSKAPKELVSASIDSASNVRNASNSTNMDNIVKKDLQEIQTNEKKKVDVIDNSKAPKKLVSASIDSASNVLNASNSRNIDNIVKKDLQEIQTNEKKKVDVIDKSKAPKELEKIQLPLKQGWRREVVERGKQDCKSKKRCDIYYYPPGYKKLRSIVEIDRYLNENPCGLTAENFSFSQSAIYKPPAEIIRRAKPQLESTPTSVKKSPAKTSNFEPKIRVKKSPKSSPILETPKKREKRRQNPSLKMKEYLESTTLFSEIQAMDKINNSSSPLNSGTMSLENKRAKTSFHNTQSYTKSVPGIENTKSCIKTVPNFDYSKTYNKTLASFNNTKSCIKTVPNFDYSKTYNKTLASFDNTKSCIKTMASSSRKLNLVSANIYKPPSTTVEDIEIDDGKVNHLCSTKCTLSRQKYPSLECCVCRCLFHPECAKFVTGSVFVCEMCKGTFVIGIINCKNQAAAAQLLSS